jgi:hypothetical protein
MVWLTALLPVKEGVGAWAALTGEADSARASGDPRRRGQVMADTLVDAIVSQAQHRRDAQTTWKGSPGQASRRPGPAVTVGLVMSDAALFGDGDEAAHVEGYGPVPAELAREIVAGACTRGERVWLRRLFTGPAAGVRSREARPATEGGDLVAMDSASRLFPRSLARFIRLRDQFCRTPWCDAPVRHIDHPTGSSRGGRTSATNGQGLCEACNYAKQAPGWAARAAPGDRHTIETRTPTGHSYRSRAPVLVTIGQTPVRLDIVLAS